jgi:hypothetical protein
MFNRPGFYVLCVFGWDCLKFLVVGRIKDNSKFKLVLSLSFHPMAYEYHLLNQKKARKTILYLRLESGTTVGMVVMTLNHWVGSLNSINTLHVCWSNFNWILFFDFFFLFKDSLDYLKIELTNSLFLEIKILMIKSCVATKSL